VRRRRCWPARPAADPLHRRGRRPARAAGVLIEFERGRPIIVDRPLYRELVKTAIKRTHDELDAKATAAAKEKKTTRSAKEQVDPVTVAKRERDAQLRELTDQAHGANLDLGHALIHNVTSVDPANIDVARFFVYALLGADHANSPYTQSGERIARIAAGGVRVVIDELRTDVTKTRKDGTRGRLRIDYGDHRDPEAALTWLWKFAVCRAAGYAEWFVCGTRCRCSALVEGEATLGIITATRGRRVGCPRCHPEPESVRHRHPAYARVVPAGASGCAAETTGTRRLRERVDLGLRPVGAPALH
jgi:hypothetical protein